MHRANERWEGGETVQSTRGCGAREAKGDCFYFAGNRSWTCVVSGSSRINSHEVRCVELMSSSTCQSWFRSYFWTKPSELSLRGQAINCQHIHQYGDNTTDLPNRLLQKLLKRSALNTLRCHINAKYYYSKDKSIAGLGCSKAPRQMHLGPPLSHTFIQAIAELETGLACQRPIH